MRTIGHSFLVMMTLSLVVGCDAMMDDPSAEEMDSVVASKAVRSAVLKDANGDAVARVRFVPIGGDRAIVQASVDFPGIRVGFHGFHIHANDNPANGEGCIADPAQPPNTHFVSADGHWNPTGATHGAHAGDMPSPLVADDGTAFLGFKREIAPLSDIVGRAVILHDGQDNFGNIPLGTAANQYTANAADAVTLTQNTGNAGNRIACGVID